MKISVLWDITPCCLSKVNRRFGGTCRLQFQSKIISQTRNRREVGSKQTPHVPAKRRLTLNGLHYVIHQEIEFFLTIAVRTSNPTYRPNI
jgi:hypothetical protein